MTRRLLPGLMACGALGGCEIFDLEPVDGSGHTGTNDTPFDEVALSTDVDHSNLGGRYTVKVKVPAGATSFQVTSTSPQLPCLERMTDPNGDEVLYWGDIFSSPYNVTQAIYPYQQDTAFNWPIQEADGPLIPGTYELEWALVDSAGNYAANAKVDVTTAIKTDPDLADGEVHVRIVWARGIDAQPKVTTAVVDAVEHWRDLWADIGITLVERYDTSDLDPDLTFAFSGSPAVNQVADSKEKGELQLIVGETVDGEAYIYGVSAGIPGTIIASRSSFVVLSWLTHAGPDGKFSVNDIQVMGETMAHEMGHYMGLFHPVESNYAQWDSLNDTDECRAPFACERDLGYNLMYPYSLCGFTTCESQYQITNDQTSVLQQAVGTL